MSTLGLTRFRAGGSRVVLRRSGARTFFASPSVGKQRLVILGSGWGGYEVLRAIDKKRWSESILILEVSICPLACAGNHSHSWTIYSTLTLTIHAYSNLLPFPEDVIIVSPTNYFNFTPLLASCSVGTLEFRSAIEPVSIPQLISIYVQTPNIQCRSEDILLKWSVFYH